MKLALFLALFQPFDNGVVIDHEAPDLAEVVAQLPNTPDTYVGLAEEGFSRLLHAPGEPSESEYERLINALRHLLMVDGRSQAALLRIAELAGENPHLSFAGVNALAGLAGYYKRGGEPVWPSSEVMSLLEALMADPELRHNARECHNALLRDGR